MTKELIEKIFSSSNSSNELFDAFDAAIKQKIEDEDLYKILLSNKTLTPEEIKLFATKIETVFPHMAFNIYLWCVQRLANEYWSPEKVNHALDCVERAVLISPESAKPLNIALSLYNHDLQMPYNQRIISIVKNNLKTVENKSLVYSHIAKFYSKLGKSKLKRKYENLAKKYKK